MGAQSGRQLIDRGSLLNRSIPVRGTTHTAAEALNHTSSRYGLVLVRAGTLGHPRSEVACGQRLGRLAAGLVVGPKGLAQK